jgi:hypothetical protein
MPEKKIDILRGKMAAGDWPAALSLASKFPHLGKHKEAITRAYNALTNPGFYRQIGKNPEALVAAGIKALAERYRA